MAKQKQVMTNAGPNPMGRPAGGGVKSTLRTLAPGGITKKEFEQVAKGTSAQNVIKQMDIMNRAGQDLRLNSGAANMLIKQMEKATPQMLGYQQPDFGGGRIAKTLQGMMGSRASGGYINPISGQQSFTAAVPSQMMIGGTQIRPGGRVAVRPMGAAPAIGDTTAATTAAGGTTATGDGTTGGDAFDFQAMFDALSAMQQPAFDMAGLESLFQTQFDQLSALFDQMDPLQLAQLGITTNPNAIRAPGGQTKSRTDYLRNALNNASASTAPLAIGGGVTI
jgi:hypothetical protein